MEPQLTRNTTNTILPGGRHQPKNGIGGLRLFEHALTDGLHVGEIALLHPSDGASDLRTRHRIQICEPFGERLMTADAT